MTIFEVTRHHILHFILYRFQACLVIFIHYESYFISFLDNLSTFHLSLQLPTYPVMETYVKGMGMERVHFERKWRFWGQSKVNFPRHIILLEDSSIRCSATTTTLYYNKNNYTTTKQ